MKRTYCYKVHLETTLLLQLLLLSLTLSLAGTTVIASTKR